MIVSSFRGVHYNLIHAHRDGFRPFLKIQGFKNEDSIRGYVNYLGMLLQAGEDSGWQPFVNLPPEWLPVLDLAKKNNCLKIVKFLALIKSAPGEITEEDIGRWIELRIKDGLRFVSLQASASATWRTLVGCGFTENAPIAALRTKRYGVLLSDFPSPLKEEVTELLRWKCAAFEPDRPKAAKIRERSARNLKQTLCGMYGYATNIAELGRITSLEQLIQKRIVASYISWCINHQKVKGEPLVSHLAAVLAAVSQHPASCSFEMEWFRPLIDTIPTESYETVKERKAKKYLDYDVLASIPAKIHARRHAEARQGENHIARLAMEELLIAWFDVFPWRQLNVRECRISGPNPNLFKAKVPEFSSIEKPTWAVKEEAENANAEFWQVKFSPEETKTSVAVHSLVPSQLISLLEEYLSKYRPLLVKSTKVATLFVTPRGRTMDEANIGQTVSDLTLRYGGRRVTPHLFRDIVAYAWLKAHPKDFLTLSKMLWHKSIATTIKYYGGRFNYSTAVLAMEEWLVERNWGPKQK